MNPKFLLPINYCLLFTDDQLEVVAGEKAKKKRQQEVGILSELVKQLVGVVRWLAD